MAAITVTFQRDVSNTYTFENVVNVEWSNQYATGLINDSTSLGGQKFVTINVNGFIKMYGDPSHNVEAQQALEDALRGVATGTLSYTGATDIPKVRFVALDFEEYRGSPIAQFTARFVTEPNNVQAHNIVTIGSLTLNAANNFDEPAVEENIEVQGPDEQLNNLKRRAITISGDMIGPLAEVNAAQAALVAEVENKTTLVVGLSTLAGGVQLTVRPRNLQFRSDKLRGTQVARTYTFECVTQDDYTKEPYTLGELPLTFAGITLDVVASIKHDVQADKDSGVYSVSSERANISGKKYFADWSAYNTFVQSFSPIPLGVYFYGSPNTYQILELDSIDIGELARDGNFPANDSKRYSADVSLQFVWRKEISETNQHYNTVRLGLNWFKISSITSSFSLNSYGDVVSRSVSISGQIFDADLASAKGLLGTSRILNDASIPGNATPYYVTSVNINRTDFISIQPGNTTTKIHEISVTANQLETAAQRINILNLLFKVATTRSVLFDRVTSQSKSLGNRYDTQNQKYVTVSANFTLSGELWEADATGSPANPNRGIDFFRLFDATQEATLSATTPPTPNYPAAIYAGGEYLPTNYSLYVTNINIGEWTPAVKPNSPNKGNPHWRQSISISAVAVFDLNSGGGSSNNEPDTVETISEQIEKQTTKFTELQVLGFGTVFKAIGINPSTAQQTIQIQYRTKQLLDAANPNPGTRSPSPPTSWGFSNFEQTKDSFEVRGLSARWIGAWKATEEEP